jgi:hypothetical protein
MNMYIPKAVVKQMGFIRETREESGEIFDNLKNFEPKIEEFPEELRNDIEPALLALFQNRTQFSVKYLYIYEMLNIPLTNKLYFIKGEDLIELCDEKVRENGKFYGYSMYYVHGLPFSSLNNLTAEDVSYITDNMIEIYNLYNHVKVTVPPTPFQIRIYKYILKRYES